ncbi:VIT1/CCC1 transporter family protein [Paludisphaera mucosa]|uniref:VIT1/CCC1 transporter family protein n=1 Tax=Paludisphaera mucosa TaxID=3030827 RepID=A0ABT6F5Y8_9BACT|nr:VIT1/CCC1 transporter family protein [Paludisphaera mucosa]MDG3003003.1 VIT1/CCC1 transporter family protein [Paludisphaera mucosa]
MSRSRSLSSRIAVYLWTAPTTMVGLVAGALTLATGGRVRVREGALEFYGGFATWMARAVGFGAMTLGHVILGYDAWWLDELRPHEQVHVRQAERWGIAFLPAYLAASVLAMKGGGHYYHDNWFERDARIRSGQEEGPGLDPPTSVAAPVPASAGESVHPERHFRASETVRDVVIGMADGLTVPFALAAGLTGAATGNSLIVTAGLAEVAAGSIAMGLGGYLAARSDAESYELERRREEREVEDSPELEEAEIVQIFEGYGLHPEQLEPILAAFRKDHAAWVDFMMKFELGLEEPDPRRAFASAATIAGSYIVGGLIPLAPYMVIASTSRALATSVVATLLALLAFGYVKGRFTGTKPVRGALQTALIGGAAAAAAFLIARVFS